MMRRSSILAAPLLGDGRAAAALQEGLAEGVAVSGVARVFGDRLLEEGDRCREVTRAGQAARLCERAGAGGLRGGRHG